MTNPSPERSRTPGGTATLSPASTDRILLQLAARIENLLDDEEQLMVSSSLDDFEQLIDRKEHLALEASRVVQLTVSHRPGPEVQASLVRMLKRLSRQAEQLRRHVEVVRSITAMICDIHCKATGDGTYDGPVGRKAGRL